MGMSASQANLLSITWRMHDNESRAQAIENAKLQLATQQDDAYEIYMDKLDAKKIQVGAIVDGTKTKYVDATFTNLCTYNSLISQQYALRDADSGKVVVSSEVYNIYSRGFNHDKYAFAWAMLGLEDNFSWKQNRIEQGMLIGVETDKSDITSDDTESAGTPGSTLMSDVEQIVFDKHKNEDGTLSGYFDKFDEAIKNGDDYFTKKEAFDTFRNFLYSSYGSEIYKYMVLDKSDPNNTDPEGSVVTKFKDKDFADIKSEFNYYVQLFEEIKDSGGCIPLKEVCEEGMSDNNWLNRMVTTGQLLIDMYDKNSKEWKETSVATCTTVNYLQEAKDDDGIEKAEAEYEHELDKINSKDKKFDRELSKLETERNALKTKMEGLKQVKTDNIERTFGIFS